MTFVDVVSIEFTLCFSNLFEILQAIISFHGRRVLPLRYVFLAAASPSSSAILCGELPSIGYRSLSESLFFLAQRKENKGVSLSLSQKCKHYANLSSFSSSNSRPYSDKQLELPLMATANYNYCYNNNSKSLKTTKTLGLSFPADSLPMRRKSRKPICVEPSFSTQKQGIWSIRFQIINHLPSLFFLLLGLISINYFLFQFYLNFLLF